MLSMKILERKRNGLNVVQCFFFSAIACILPYLSAHMREIGITKIQSAWINAIVALVSMIGPLCLGPIAYKYNKYKTILVASMLLSFIAYTSLLLVPRVILTERQPKMYFDCSQSKLLIEKCPNWDKQCDTMSNRPAANFSNFMLSSCAYECAQIMTTNISWYPINLCFIASTAHNEEGNICQVQAHPDYQGERSSVKFDTKFDRWPLVEHTDAVVERVFGGRETCTYDVAPPLILYQKLYDNINCRPNVPNCNVYCSVRIQHRRKSRNSPEVQLKPPTPCQIVIGDPSKTFFSYLAIRIIADLSLFTAFTLLDALAIALTNDFDAIYGGFAKLWAIIIPMIAWPPICGQLVDFFSSESAGNPNYAPPIIVFDGLIVIASFFVISMPLSPNNLVAKSVSQTIGQSATLIATKSYPRTHKKGSAILRLTFLFPLILWLGAQWGLLDTFLHPFYVDMGSSKLALGLTFTETFLAAAPFVFIAKSLINGVGRIHLIVLAFIFYALRFAGISYLLYPKWLIVPFEMMEAFSLPIAWIGITSYCHHLIKRSPNATSFESGVIFQKYSPHIVMQYTLNLLHFGGGRALGAAIGGVWLTMWSEHHSVWMWLSDYDIDYADDSNNLDDALRVLLRLGAIISATLGLLLLFIYHLCCVGIKKPNFKRDKQVSSTTPKSEAESAATLLNGNYTRLVDQQPQSDEKSQSVQMQKQANPQTQLSNTHSQSNSNNKGSKKISNGNSNGDANNRIRMADEDVTDDEISLNRK